MRAKKQHQCSECAALNRNYSTGHPESRWVLVVAVQTCIWQRPTAKPKVDIKKAVRLQTFCCESHAFHGLKNYLLFVGAVAQWSGVRAIEVCACCGRDFDTARQHKTLALLVEGGPQNRPELLRVNYPARFCTECAPVDVPPAIPPAANQAQSDGPSGMLSKSRFTCPHSTKEVVKP
jgi:hypothetical protein